MARYRRLLGVVLSVLEKDQISAAHQGSGRILMELRLPLGNAGEAAVIYLLHLFLRRAVGVRIEAPHNRAGRLAHNAKKVELVAPRAPLW